MSQTAQQRRQQQVDREIRLEAARRAAYGALIDASKQLSAAWWRVADQLRDATSTPEQWQESAAAAHAAWMRFSTTVASVTVAGPGPVAEAADSLRRAMSALDKAGMDWHKAARCEGTGLIEACDAHYRHAAKAKRVPGSEFQLAARRALNAED
ncbi:hypothetical protein [Streptomyces sp. ok210]|uniref:hypothetical protein n=1 Tax=Streptomyces sp. ok210 TaxID=1761905 RepID=UPI00116089B0|nr:hypothetical protein [Streptomyces sp. ok210]